MTIEQLGPQNPSSAAQAVVALFRSRDLQAISDAAWISEPERGLMRAAVEGDAPAIGQLLPLADAKAKNALGDTALILAARHGQTEALRLLLAESDADARGEGGQTALMRACAQGSFRCFEALLKVSDFNAQDDQGNIALIHAFESVRSNSMVFFHQLLSVCDLSSLNRAGDSPLTLIAASDNHQCWSLTDVVADALSDEQLAAQWPRVRPDRKTRFESNWKARGLPLFARVEAAALREAIDSDAQSEPAGAPACGDSPRGDSGRPAPSLRKRPLAL